MTDLPAPPSPHATPSVIRLDGVVKRLGGRNVLDGLTLEIRQGETFVIIGRSGTGKSVTLKHMVGLMKPDSGAVHVGNEDITGYGLDLLTRIRRRIGFLFQNGALLQSMTVFENVALPLREHAGWSEDRIGQVVLQKLRQVEMQHKADAMPADLSGGMRKRVALARAIVMDPEVILYDEPTAGLDPVMSSTINELVVRTQEEMGVTSVIVTHDMESAYFVADRIGMLHEGKMHAIGTAEEVRETSDPILRQFVRGEVRGPLSRGEFAEGNSRA